MPELPEVETVVRALADDLIGKVPAQVVVRTAHLRAPTPTNLDSLIIGKPIIGTRRRAKWPALVFDNGCLWLHLGMTGRIIVHDKAPRSVTRHDHLDLIFTDGSVLRFSDPRRFGLVAWTDGAQSEPPVDKLGPEPLDEAFDAEVLAKQLKRTARPIKVVLLDGAVVAGIGNIYAAEALFLAGIHPAKPAKEVTADECEALVHAIKVILYAAIQAGGSTLRDYRKPSGDAGAAQLLHRVYNKAGQRCDVCNTPIKTMLQAGRSTFWCDTCQPKRIPEAV